MKPEISYVKLQDRYGGQYIVYRNARVLAHANTLGKLLREVKRRRLLRKTVTFRYVPTKDPCIYAW